MADVIRLLWTKRMLLCLCALGGLAVGLAAAWVVPKRYTAVVQLVSENEQEGILSELSGLEPLIGLNINTLRTAKNLSTALYPDIVASTPFLTALCAEELAGKTAAESYAILQRMRKNIDVWTDNKSGLTTVAVTRRDPAEAAQLADSVVVRLERVLTGTRTGKARADLAFTEARFEEARANYYAAQETYAGFVDRNRHLNGEAAAVERERLRDERQVAYTVFSQLAGQLELARIRVQEQTPVLTVIEPAVEPVRHSWPRRSVWALAGLVLGAVIAGSWMIGKEIF